MSYKGAADKAFSAHMPAYISFFWLIIILLIPVSMKAGELQGNDKIIHHDLKVVLYPKEHRFSAEDTITVPGNLLPEIYVQLHKGLHPSSPTHGVTVANETKERQNVPFKSFRVKLPQGVKTFMLKYGGIINHPIEQHGKEQARGFSQTIGIVSEEGIYLSGSSYWYPMFDKELMVAFKLQIELPADWDAVSQGERTFHTKNKDSTLVQWDSSEQQEEIFIVAGKFHEYIKSTDRIQAMVFLRTPDKGLADKYLDAAIRYITMYEKLIGSYPYKKFALVENFWETGFGMPSFTLLGPKVIRFPFIINSSYPHEILHNWWGNSVFPDYSRGNWSEGLTAYLSDHLLKEQQGEGAEYRETTLQKYTDYVLSGRDFPLTEFHSRHSSSSEAIGYGKSLMFFHMLRLELGDKIFIEGLQDFYHDNKFRLAAFDDLRRSFEHISGKDLKSEFDQWITKPGAPKLEIENVKVHREADKYILTAALKQLQEGKACRLRIPIAITMEGQKKAYQTYVSMDKSILEIKFNLPSRPLRIDVDPEFDLFRRLDRDEIPPAITQALGAGKMLVILPSSANAALQRAYHDFAKALGNSGPDEVEAKLDTEIIQIPSDRAVTVIGRENRFFNKVVSALSAYEVSVNQSSVHIEKAEISFANHSIVLTARNPENRDMALMFITSDLPGALSGLSRKLPHYHKYSYLVFTGSEPENIAKGRWPVTGSPMTVFIPGEDGRIEKVKMGELSRRNPLAIRQPGFSAEQMMETVKFLSSDELKGRALATEELDQAAEYIARKFQEAGLKPAGDGKDSYFQIWEDEVGDKTENKVIIKNIIGVIPGKKQEWHDQSIVVGAHYDHLGIVNPDVQKENQRQIYYGADDNASGISLLIELARVLSKSLNPERSVVFVAFTGEEAGKKGSKYYITNRKRYPANNCIGMLNLDTVGRLGKNKLLVLEAGSAKEWVYIFRGASYVAGVEIETVSGELDSSDQKSFQEAGVPAVQLFTGPHTDYHKSTDSADKIDSEGLVKVATVAKEVIEYLAKREQPLSATIQSEEKAGPEPKKERKVSLGIIPDFTFHENGCRLSGVVQGSPAEKAGLREEDIIIRINTAPVNKLKDLSEILKSLKPGEKVSITFLREGKEKTVDAFLTER